jgi:hypothetical protein
MIIKTYIPREKLEKIARDAGCVLTEKTTCIMVKKGTSPNRLYIAKTAGVNRVNINGFRVPDPALAATPPGGTMGTFLQVVRFDYPVAQVLANFKKICEQLDSYTPVKNERKSPASFRGTKRKPIESVVQIVTVETPRETIDRLVSELSKKEEMAKKLGFPLSPKTVKEYHQKISEAKQKLEA